MNKVRQHQSKLAENHNKSGDIVKAHILIADDHDLYRDGLKAHIQQIFGDEDVRLQEACNYGEAAAIIQENPNFDICLMDLNMPGPPSLKELITRYPGLPIIVISATDKITDMQSCFDIGVMGFVPKSEPAAVIIKAIELVMAGGLYVPSVFINGQQQAPSKERSPLNDLTPRQQQVLGLIEEGCSNKEIAREMNLAESTVKSHLAVILKTFNVKNRTQAVVFAQNLRNNA